VEAQTKATVGGGVPGEECGERTRLRKTCEKEKSSTRSVRVGREGGRVLTIAQREGGGRGEENESRESAHTHAGGLDLRRSWRFSKTRGTSRDNARDHGLSKPILGENGSKGKAPAGGEKVEGRTEIVKKQREVGGEVGEVIRKGKVQVEAQREGGLQEEKGNSVGKWAMSLNGLGTRRVSPRLESYVEECGRGCRFVGYPGNCARRGRVWDF